MSDFVPRDPSDPTELFVDSDAIDAATGDAPRPSSDASAPPTPQERAAALAHAALAPAHPMPAALRERAVGLGRAMVAASTARPAALRPRRVGPALIASMAAAVVLAGAAIAVLGVALRDRSAALDASEARLAEMRQQVEDNRRILAETRAEADSVAARLALLTEELDAANIRIAQFEAPIDPEAAASQRRTLLATPGSVRVAWEPFDLPDAPAEQRGIGGDVVWNDDTQAGYLRFTGLKVNDPAVEQYQVWLIDERGMEQKVSGGVFNATRDGEVIIPIRPGIDVGRVEIFAVTIENPGGTWVPDLSRRVVVAPRGS